MPDDLENDPLIRLGVAASLASRYAADQRDFLPYLSVTLERALPDSVVIIRKGGLFGSKRVTGLSMELGGYQYRLEEVAHGLHATVTKVVRGIKLKTETLTVEEWFAELGAALEEQARASQAARNALEALFGG